MFFEVGLTLVYSLLCMMIKTKPIMSTCAFDVLLFCCFLNSRRLDKVFGYQQSFSYSIVNVILIFSYTIVNEYGNN